MKTRSTAATIVCSLLLIPSFAAYADDGSSPDFNLVPLADKGKVDVHGLIRDSSINENHYVPPNSTEDSNNIASSPPPSIPQPTPKVSVIHSDMRDTAYCEWHTEHGRAAQPCPPSPKWAAPPLVGLGNQIPASGETSQKSQAGFVWIACNCHVFPEYSLSFHVWHMRRRAATQFLSSRSPIRGV